MRLTLWKTRECFFQTVKRAEGPAPRRPYEHPIIRHNRNGRRWRTAVADHLAQSHPYGSRFAQTAFGSVRWRDIAGIQYVGHSCDGRQQTVLRKTQATEALPPWPRQAVPFALPRPWPESSCPASPSYKTCPARLHSCGEEVLRP